ncbi:MAG: SLBB domain-containing protein [Snowella sp.]|nr:SLBB domain-containing protein [Snowella sp.]
MNFLVLAPVKSQRARRFTSFCIGSVWLMLGLAPLPVLAKTPNPNPSNRTSTAAIPPMPPALSAQPTESDYILGPGDRLRMDIYQVEEFSKTEYQVLVDGTISFPLVGILKVQGMTLPQLTSTLNQRYAKYIKRPIITIGLLQPRPLTITLAGEINSPGSYTLPISQGQKFPTVTDIIQQAGGLTPSANVSNIVVKRTSTPSQPENIQLNLWDLIQKGDSSQNITLRDGDTIVISAETRNDPAQVRQLVDANFGIRFDSEINVAVVGEVVRPGAYKLTPAKAASNSAEVGGSGGGGGAASNTARTGVRQPVRLTQALQEAGGIKPIADIRQIEVRRQNRSGQEEKITVNLWELLEQGNLDKDLVLQNGDTITVAQAQNQTPEQFDTLATANFAPKSIRVNVVGEVKRPGLIELPPNSTLNQGLLAGGGFDTRRADRDNVELIRLNPNGTVTRMSIQPNFGEGINDQNNPTLRNNDVILVNPSSLASTTDTIGTIFSPLGAILGGGLFSILNLLN